MSDRKLVDRTELAPFLCREDATLWFGIERCLDNGVGIVLVVDINQRLLGQVDLSILREAVRSGLHLSSMRIGELVQPVESGRALAPVLDSTGKVVDVIVDRAAGGLPVSEPDLSHHELRYLLDAFLSKWISSTGDYVRTFERRFADLVEMKEGVAVSNGTVALHLALAALGIGEGDEVIVPDLTFAATANAVIHVGARPVIVDVDPTTWCIDPGKIKQAITPRTRAVIPVHVFGRPAPMTEIAAICRAHGLYIIEDCAEAHTARYDGKPVGSFSDVSTFSFFANKIMTTGEGGICLANDPAIASRMRMLRDHGMRPERRYWHEDVGFNFRMTNLQAAIGCAQLDRLPELLAMRRAVHDCYVKSLAAIPGVEFQDEPCARSEPVIWFSCARVPAHKRQELIAACAAAGIDLRPFFNTLSAMPAFKRYGRPNVVSQALSQSGVNLPTSSRVDLQIAERIASIFRSVLKD